MPGTKMSKNNTILELAKARIGISSRVRDEYLEKIIEGVQSELEDQQGVSIDLDSPHVLMFLVDFATWRYQNRDTNDGMPRHLQFRLHNLIVSSVNKNDDG